MPDERGTVHKRRSRGRSWTLEDALEMQRAWKRGATAREIGGRWGLSHLTVLQALASVGTSTRRRGGPGDLPRSVTRQLARTLVAEYKRGATIRVLADRHGLTCGTTRSALIVMGVSMRPAATRMVQLICPVVACGYTVRTSARWLEVGLPLCPCGTEMRRVVGRNDC